MRRHSPSEPMDWERPSDRFLAYLERLSEACVARDRETLDKLMRMRFSSHVPRAVLDELEFFRRAKDTNLRAPMKLMRYVHQMKQLATAPMEQTQLGLGLREREVAAPVAATTRRTPEKKADGSLSRPSRRSKS
jgi:hypothetical protein